MFLQWDRPYQLSQAWERFYSVDVDNFMHIVQGSCRDAIKIQRFSSSFRVYTNSYSPKILLRKCFSFKTCEEYLRY